MPNTKDLLIEIIDQVKNKKLKEYKRSYSYVSKNISDSFEEQLSVRNLSHNKKLLKLVEEYKQKVYNLHQNILIALEDYANKEKHKTHLMMETELINITPKEYQEYEKQLEQMFDISLYEASNIAHVNFQIDLLLRKL